ncbi:hypothetical protein FHR70_000713 [Microvirga lupini]|uniref:Uncharacterized protein n=1 Tax=Microvirga lupini TaxID=420324 RepID=A0A7W4VI60_9HYPH|nr:hypothetical protein [Microvirga lupini]MBB3017673.1 hypothetical protein [Microvirga lupini]
MTITRITITASRPRKQPKAGDERFLKGRQVTQIRQQEMHVYPGGNGRMAGVVSNGRPVWEWVDKGSDRDRTSAAWKAKRAAELAERAP